MVRWKGSQKKYLGKNVVLKYSNANNTVKEIGLVERLGENALTLKTMRSDQSYLIPFNYSVGLKIKKIKCFKGE